MPVFTEMTRCHGYSVTKAMAVEVDTDKYYFERILIAHCISGFLKLERSFRRSVLSEVYYYL